MISEIMNKYALKNTKKWAHDRSLTIGASEIGQCARQMYYLKMEHAEIGSAKRNPDHIDTWGPKWRGSVYEARFWYPAMKAHYQKNLHFAGPNQHTFVHEFISATPDGLVHLPKTGECFTVECKTIDPRSTLNEAKTKNVYQTHMQMGLIREQTEFKPTHSVLSYTDASFWDEVTEFIIPFDEEIYENGKRRAAEIMLARDPMELRAEGLIAGGKECKNCPFSNACGIDRSGLVPKYDATVDPQFAAEITDKVRYIQRLDGEVSKLATNLAAEKEELKVLLSEKGVRKIPGVVTWSAVKGRSGYDNKALKDAAIEAGIDIEAFKITGDPSDRLTISLPIDSEITQARSIVDAA
jgi:hypothetical protein